MVPWTNLILAYATTPPTDNNRSLYTFWKNATAGGSASDRKNQQRTRKTRVKIEDLQNFE
jgi:hypothetical protein